MEKKRFFIDFDGTLMRDDKTISDKNREALRNAVDQGHYIALATGRAVSSGRRIAKELELTRPGCYLVAYNGGTIYDFSADCILSPLGANKGYGVEFLCDFLGVPIENAVAIGDEENDISMIRNAGVGVAMKNAVQSVKDAADYVTEHDNNEDGVAEVIEKFS